MARLFSIRPGITLRGRKFLGIRGWNGKPTHPPLTDFPIVCYVVAALFDVLSWLGWFGSGGRFSSRDLFRAATLVMVVGFVVSLATGTFTSSACSIHPVKTRCAPSGDGIGRC